jgi:hypothetical protein
MGKFPEILIAKCTCTYVGRDFFVLEYFHGQKILKVDGRDGRDSQNREKNAPAGRFTCMHMLIVIMNFHFKVI